MKCVKCDEALIAPDWSESVSEGLIVNLWTCTKCGHRFETKAFMPAAEPKMSEKDWEQMFPPLLTRYDKLAANYLAFINLINMHLATC
jgi:hypothetical protein